MKFKKTFEQMQKFIGEGRLIEKIHRSFQFTDEPKFFQYTAYMSNFSKKTDACLDDENHGSGLDMDEKVAKIKAIGECVERYCLQIYREKKFVKKSFNEIQDKAISPLNFINYFDIRNKKYQKNILNLQNSKLNWTDCIDYLNKQKKLIPSQLIYVPYRARETTLRNPISNGAACATTKNEAIYKGICELIERDSFMLYYLKKISPKKIVLNSLKNKKIKKILSRFKRYFLEVHLLDITTDLNVPSILCILIDRSGVGPAVSIGSKTDFDVNKAICGALLEAEHTRIWIRSLMIAKNRVVDNKNKIISLEDRGLYWSNKNKINKLNFMIKSKKNISFDDFQKNTSNKLDRLVKILKKHKYNLFIKDLTPVEIKEKGFFVIKSIIPELHPLFLFEDLKYLYGNRINDICKKGNHNRKIINGEPHPFV